ncbi:PTS sugar transporter subunit IIA [Parvularcula oceani]|uniref:PTS sugar transporter subunit IIA n=1 Tax=Parvularcula oceani TaxID=1247963 RepID=UPI0004E1CC58|nr:PTS sugar transporter subunit IIA [Parvularcula oceani]
MANDIKDLLRTQNVLVGVPARCQRDVLARLSRQAASAFDLDEEAVLATLTERERLGSTGIGRGIAVPHGKAPVREICGVMLQLAEPVDFDSVDDEPVDLVFLLLAPEGDDAGHLKALSRVARRLRSKDIQTALRGAQSPEALYTILAGEDAVEAA